MQNPVKPFWASKTLWANVVAAAAAVSGLFEIDIGLTPEEQISLVGAIMAGVNIFLRLVTSSSVGLTRG